MKRITALLTLFFVTLTYAVDVQWSKAVGGNGHFYGVRLVSGGIHWDAAYREAKLSGGYLATITSEEENDFITNFIVNNPNCWVVNPNGQDTGPWIGGYQPVGSPEPNGNWQWVTGETFGYTKWAGGIPSDSMGDDKVGESRLHLTRDNDLKCYWNDFPVTKTTIAYIIEIEPNPCLRYIPGDYNNDCKIDFLDFATLADNWLECNLDPFDICWND